MTRKSISKYTPLMQFGSGSPAGVLALRAVVEEFLAELGDGVQPKFRPALLKETPHSLIFGLFSLSQARHPGRTADFEGLLRLGGLVVSRGETPALGAVEVWKTLPAQPPDPAGDATLQRLRTDGRLWQTWTRDIEGRDWRLREESMSPAMEFPASGDGTIETAAIRGFEEFLRRGLLCWKERGRPESLALRLASHAREEAERLEREEPGRLHDVARVLQESVGLFIDCPAAVAQLLVATQVLEEATHALPGRHAVEAASTMGSPPGFSPSDRMTRAMREWLGLLHDAVLSISPAEYQAHHAAPLFETRLYDRHLLDFCLTFWRELAGAQRPGDNSTPEHRAHAEAQAQAFAAMLGPRLRKAATVFDLNAGHGDFLMAWIFHHPDFVENKTSLVACEAHPVGWFIIRLRLAVAAWTLKISAKQPPVIVDWRNIFRDGIPAGERKSLVFGETRPHLGAGLSLSVTPGAENLASHGWGSQLRHYDLATTRYLETARRLKPVGMCLRLSASWTDEEENASDRERLLEGIGPLYLHADAAASRPDDKRRARGDVVLVSLPEPAEKNTLPQTYRRAAPRRENRFSLLPKSAYFDWPMLTELAAQSQLNGPIERRGMMLIDIDRDRLDERMRDYFGDMTDRQLKRKYPFLMKNVPRFDAAAVREQLRAQTRYHPERMERYSFRPFDDRFVYRHGMRPLFSEPANELFFLARGDNAFLVASAGQDKALEGVPAWWSRLPCDYDFFAGRSGHFPVWVFEGKIPRRRRDTLSEHEVKSFTRVANLSTAARDYLTRLGYSDPDHDPEVAKLIWHHALAVLYTPAYQEENREALRHGWPRIPLPGFRDDMSKEQARQRLEASARHGKQIADILSGVSRPDPDLVETVAVLTVDGNPTTPEAAAALDPELLSITTGWGASAKREGRNLVRAREGKTVTRPYTPAERIALQQAAQRHDLKDHAWNECLGTNAVDVYLNERTRWTGIPKKVWDYTVGGRQVLPKWLSYRENGLLRRFLLTAECQDVSNTATLLTSLLFKSTASHGGPLNKWK